MKSYMQMANDVFAKIEEQRLKQAKRKRAAARRAAIAGGVCAAAVLIAAAVNGAVNVPEAKHPLSVSDSAYTAPRSTASNGVSDRVSHPTVPNKTSIKSGAVTTTTQDHTQSGISFDMVPLVVHDGRIYTVVTEYIGPELENVLPLLEKHLGRTGGDTDCSMSANQLRESPDLTSGISGEAYTMRGYPERFRICVMTEGGSLMVFETVSAASVTKGAELFEDLLGLSGRIDAFCEEGGETLPLRPEDDIFTRFFSELNEAHFENVEDIIPELYKDPLKWAAMHIRLADGTRIRLHLFEGGYVIYPGSELIAFAAKLPGEVFEPVFNNFR